MPDRILSSDAAALAPAQIQRLIDALADYPVSMRERGRSYAANGHVGSLQAGAGSLRAPVHGTRTYDARWDWKGHDWTDRCTCPVAVACKHLYALASVALVALQAAGRTNDPRLARLLPGRDAAFRTSHAAREPDPFAEAARPRAPSATHPVRPARALEDLRAAAHSWQRVASLRLMLRERPELELATHLPPFDAILEESDPDLLCWRLAQALPAHTGGWIPPALRPFAEREDLRKRFLEQEQDRLAGRLVAWAAPPTASAERQLRFVLGLGQATDGLWALRIEARVTTTRAADTPRTVAQLEQLQREAARRPGLLSEESMELLEVYLSNLVNRWGGTYAAGNVATTTTARRLIELGSGTGGVTWSDELDPAVAARAGIAPGQPVRFGALPVRIVPSALEQGGRVALSLEARWPDERAHPLTEAILVPGTSDGTRRHPSLLVCAGEVHAISSRPPDDVVTGLLEASGLTLDPARHSRLVSELTTRFPTLRESLAPFVREIGAQPVFALALGKSDWLQIRLLAAPRGTLDPDAPSLATAEGLHEFVPGTGWSPPSRAALPADPAKLTLLDPRPLAPAIEWLERTGAGEGPSAGWWIHISAARLDALEALWRERPLGARWYCDAEAKRLLIEGSRVRATLRARSSGVDWFAFSAEWESGELVLTPEDMELLRRATGPFVRVSSGWVRRDEGEEVERAALLFADVGIEVGAGEQRLSLWQLAQARPESLAALSEFGLDPETVAAVERVRTQVREFTGLPAAPLPTGFVGTLRPYQQHGLDFLSFASTLGIGAVLADDMGLGKTIQALAWLLSLRAGAPRFGPTLVVCPASVVHNWVREAERFAPGLPVVRLTGTAVERRDALDRGRKGGLIVTNYALLRRDLETLREIEFGAVILDEAQNIKNPDAAVSKAARALHSRHRLALTGTPLENRALDLWSILAFTSPEFLGTRRSFVTRFDKADAPPHLRRLLAAKLRPVLLRRMKQEVAPELPERTEERLDCELLPAQHKLYLDQLERGRAMLAKLIAGGEGLDRHQIEILSVLTRLRQICCHPALVGAPARTPSGKFEALWEVLEPLLAEGHKVLLFSQFVQCLALIEAGMKERGIPSHLLTGKTREKDRERVVREFTEDQTPSVFLVSLKAGGTGLNLTAASHVILFDPWWNPAVEAQAIDRTHRIGQTQKVTAFRLLTRGTIEEKIWELQQKKAAMAKEILGEDGFARTLTRADLEYLLEPGA